MSGWDEGQVFYSDPAMPDDADERDEEEEGMGLTRYAAQRRLKEFLRSFHDPRYRDAFIYRERLQRNPSVLEVDLEDLASKEEILNKSLRSNPADILPLFEVAAAEVASGMKGKVTGESGDLEDAALGDVQILLKSDEDCIGIRNLDASHISKLVKLPGTDATLLLLLLGPCSCPCARRF